MSRWVAATSGVAVLCFVIVLFGVIGRSREVQAVSSLEAALEKDSGNHTEQTVQFSSLEQLPPPVKRYFQSVLADGQPMIAHLRMAQEGKLRTSTEAENWSAFTAKQFVVPSAKGFMWNAVVATPLNTHVRVLDSYIDGIGAGRVSLLSILVVASEVGVSELNSGALHRYLAEAVWYPTALLPQSGVKWTAIDDHSALATLTDKTTTVSLEFRFNDSGEVASVFSTGRYGNFDGTYKQVPWEGHFKNYQTVGEMKIPSYGEVGWYVGDSLQLVWKGNVTAMEFSFER